MAVNLVWLKRDLRLADNQALFHAATNGNPVLLMYCFEPTVLRDKHTSKRHLTFIAQSLVDIKMRLPDGALYCAYGDCLEVLEQLSQVIEIEEIYSHQEVGLGYTYARDKQVAKWCSSKNITWHEFPHGAVIRGLKNRTNWDENWQAVMRSKTLNADIEHMRFFYAKGNVDESCGFAVFLFNLKIVAFFKRVEKVSGGKHSTLSLTSEAESTLFLCPTLTPHCNIAQGCLLILRGAT